LLKISRNKLKFVTDMYFMYIKDLWKFLVISMIILEIITKLIEYIG